MAPPQSVLIVEDEILVAMLLEDMLRSMGIAAVRVAGTLEEALCAAAEGAVDWAILDVHLRGRAVFPVAGILAERGIPFVFATGLGDAIPGPYGDRPVLQKPFTASDLKRVLATL